MRWRAVCTRTLGAGPTLHVKSEWVEEDADTEERAVQRLRAATGRKELNVHEIQRLDGSTWVWAR